MPANFYNQISKYCCGESAGNNEGWIRIDSNQEIERTGYARINFNISKGYTPSRITIKPLGGSTPDSLNHRTSFCSSYGDYNCCYYKFKDVSLSSTDTRERKATITAEKDGYSSKKISAQARVTVESADGGGENIHHCGVNETYNTTSGKREPKGDDEGGGGS